VPANLFELTACIAETQALRFTPVGVPALNLSLEHSSQIPELGVDRTVNLALKAVAFGALAERLATQAVGSLWKFRGFLANARQGKTVVFHIQEFVQD